MAQSRHSNCRDECPLWEAKRTLQFRGDMSGDDPNRTVQPFQTFSFLSILRPMEKPIDWNVWRVRFIHNL